MAVGRAVLGYVEARDHRVMRRVNGWRAPWWFRWLMLAASRLGDGWLWAALGIALLAYGGRQRFAAVGSAGLSACAGIVLFWAVKKVCKRERPCELAPHCWATLRPPDEFSFPSGHTITAFTIAFSVGFFYPGMLAALLVVATIIAVSRIVLGMHFVSDVLIGAAIGTGLACASFHLIR
jgi:undecaprenyl-diphosphatase